MKTIRIILSPDAKVVYHYLNKQAPTSKRERMIFSAINKKIELVKQNPHYGEPLAKRLIPDEYKIKYGVTNLFRVELSLFWRMLYTLTNGSEGGQIIAFILEILPHKKYDKLLGYSSN